MNTSFKFFATLLITCGLTASSSLTDAQTTTAFNGRFSNKIAVGKLTFGASAISVDTADIPARTVSETPLFLNASGDFVKGTLVRADLPAALAYEDEANVFSVGQLFAADTRSSSFSTGVTGWRITANGESEFRYSLIDEMVVKQFTTDLQQVSSGRHSVTYSSTTVAQAFTCPSAASSETLWVRDAPSSPNQGIFAANDWVVLYIFNRTGTSLTAVECTGQVASYADGTGLNDGQQSWIFTRGGSIGPSCSGNAVAGTNIAVDTAVVDYGASGSGYVETVATPGTYGGVTTTTPYLQMVTWTACPVPITRAVQVKMGQLNGSYGFASSTFGFAAGNEFGTHITMEPVGGFSIWNAATRKFQADTSGNMFLAGNLTVTGSGSFGAGGVTIDTNGIQIGQASSTSDYANQIRMNGRTAMAVIFGLGASIFPSDIAYWGLSSGYTNAGQIAQKIRASQDNGPGDLRGASFIVNTNNPFAFTFDWDGTGSVRDIGPQDDNELTIGSGSNRFKNINLALPNNAAPAIFIVNKGGGGADQNSALGYIGAGLTQTVVVKGSTGANCNLNFTAGLLTSTTCP